MKIKQRASTPVVEAEPDTAISGVVRLERDNRVLGRKLGQGDVAVIDHPDLDRHHAEALVARGVSAVVNVSASSSGRYPNNGPLVLARAGIALIDHVGPSIWSAVKNGERVRIVGGTVMAGDRKVATGAVLDEVRIRALHDAAERQLHTQLEALSANAADHLQRERDLFLDGSGVPLLDPSRRGRPMVVVSREHDWDSDLAGLRSYIRSYKPILVGAGAGADALLHAGYTPEVVVGPIDELSDRAMKAAAEVVVTTSTGVLPPLERLDRLGLDARVFPGVGTPEDLALLLADTNEAELIVVVGGHDDLLTLLDRGPTDAAGTMLARLRSSSRVVDAKALGAFYRRRAATWPLVLLALVAIAGLVAAIATTPVGQDWFEDLGSWAGDLADTVKGWFA